MATYRSPTLGDFAWQPPVDDRVIAPTELETKGYRYIIIATATGIFAGKENQIATAKQTTPTLAEHWYFDTPTEGWRCRVLDENVEYVYDGAVWNIEQSVAITATPTFANASLGTGELTCGSINRASGNLTLEIGGTEIWRVTSTYVYTSQDILMGDGHFIGLGGSAGRLVFDATGVDKLYFADCNVGINVVAPVYKFQVKGVTTGGTDVVGTFTDSADVGFWVGATGGVAGVLSAYGTNQHLYFTVSGTGIIKFNTATLERMIIGANGNVGISTSAYYTSEIDNGNSGSADTVVWTAGNKQKSTLTDNCTFTFTAPTGPSSLQLKLIQDGTGSRLVTWPATVIWPDATAPTLSTGAGIIDFVSFYYDGTNYFGQYSLNFNIS